MKKQPLYLATLLAVLALPVSSWAQEKTPVGPELSQTVKVVPRTLEDYRTLALKHNKSLQVAQMAVTKAEEEHRVARTNYLPKVSAVGAYFHTGDNLSLLSTDQQASLSTLGTQLMQGVTPEFMQAAQGFLAKHPDLFPLLQKGMVAGKQAEAGLNAMGSNLVDKLTPDTRNVAVGAVMFTQPLYMGGKIRAYDRLTGYSTQLAGEKVRQAQQELMYDVDKAYWQVVSLHHKRAGSGISRPLASSQWRCGEDGARRRGNKSQCARCGSGIEQSRHHLAPRGRWRDPLAHAPGTDLRFATQQHVAVEGFGVGARGE